MEERVSPGKSLPNITIHPSHSQPDAKQVPDKSYADLPRPTQTGTQPNVAYLTFPASKSAPSITIQTFPVRIYLRSS